ILIPQMTAPLATAAGKGPVSSQPYVPPPAPPQPPADPNQRLLTPAEEGRQDLVHGPGEQPLRDFNLIRSKIGPVLDEPVSTANPSVMARGESMTRDATLDALREAVTDSIPFHSWIRMLT